VRQLVEHLSRARLQQVLLDLPQLLGPHSPSTAALESACVVFLLDQMQDVRCGSSALATGSEPALTNGATGLSGRPA
jgi:hypothetical protein